MAAAQQEWLIIIPDHPNKLSKRMEIRPKHIEGLGPNINAGKVVFGGASLDSPLKEGEGMKANGSAMVLVCETKEEALEIVKNDIYTREGVWNVEGLQIMPFKSAVRKAL